MRIFCWVKYAYILLVALSVSALLGEPALNAAESPARTKIRIATASPSLSYLPIYTAVKKGYFAKRGFDVEMIQMSASLTAPALLNRAIDYTTIPSTIATATARGAPAKVIFFASVKLQHMLLARGDIATVNDLAGGVRAYDSVKDTYSRNEQSKAYIAMLAVTAGVSADLASATIFDFSFAAAAAKELAAKNETVSCKA